MAADLDYGTRHGPDQFVERHRRFSGSLISVTPPGWGAKIAPGQQVSVFGFCASGSGEPTDVKAVAVG